MTHAPELVEKVKRRIDATMLTGGTLDAVAQAVIPIIENNLLREIRNWKPTEYGVYGWQESGLNAFARERGLLEGEE